MTVAPTATSLTLAEVWLWYVVDDPVARVTVEPSASWTVIESAVELTTVPETEAEPITPVPGPPAPGMPLAPAPKLGRPLESAPKPPGRPLAPAAFWAVPLPLDVARPTAKPTPPRAISAEITSRMVVELKRLAPATAGFGVRRPAVGPFASATAGVSTGAWDWVSCGCQTGAAPAVGRGAFSGSRGVVIEASPERSSVAPDPTGEAPALMPTASVGDAVERITTEPRRPAPNVPSGSPCAAS